MAAFKHLTRLRDMADRQVKTIISTLTRKPAMASSSTLMCLLKTRTIDLTATSSRSAVLKTNRAATWVIPQLARTDRTMMSSAPKTTTCPRARHYRINHSSMLNAEVAHSAKLTVATTIQLALCSLSNKLFTRHSAALNVTTAREAS